MYSEDKNFTSDLINSYAWDTAIVFIQTFGQSNYSRQSSLNTRFALQGTNNLAGTAKDQQCNIWDMASNGFEWTTETYSVSNYPCVVRGGSFNLSSYYASNRDYGNLTTADSMNCFRLTVYL